MIPLHKHTEAHPEHGRSIAWLAARDAAYRKARRRGETIDKYLRNYSNPDVKASLRDETAEKCAYCEAKYGSTSYGDIEHVLPRSNDPERLLQYENLTIACQICNIQKGVYESPNMPLIDPYEEDPTTRIVALGAHIFPIPGTDDDERAANTLAAFKLNERLSLVDDRAKVMAEIVSLAKAYRSSKAPAVRDAALRKLRLMTSRRGEFALTARSAMEKMLPEVPLDDLY
jgi:uncharacterized protein (TIGR02646 family)